MGYEFVTFSADDLLTHQKMGQLADNDELLAFEWANYKRPNLKYVNANVVTVEENTGVANESKTIYEGGEIQFADGVETGQFRGCDLTKTAEFTTGVPLSGLHSSYTLTNNRWYYIYAVKVNITGNTEKFVLVASETAPLRSNAGTLFSEFGVFGFCYLGTIRYGDSASNPSAVLDFKMSGGLTLFKNIITGNCGFPATGTQLATSAGASSLSYTYSAGGGDLQIPSNIDIAIYAAAWEDTNDNLSLFNQPQTINLLRGASGLRTVAVPADFGLFSQTLASKGGDIFLAGFRDGFFQPDHNKLYW